MLKYILYRLLLFIPMLIVISLLAFYISLQEPRDPVDMILGPQQAELNMGAGKPELYPRDYLRRKRKITEELHLDRPLFYFALNSLAVPDTFYRIPNKETRQALHQIVFRSGNWEAVQEYHERMKRLLVAHEILAKTLKEKVNSEPQRLILAKEIKDQQMILSDSSGTAWIDDPSQFRFKMNYVINESLGIVQKLPRNGNHQSIQARLLKLEKMYAKEPFLDELIFPLKEVITAYKAIESKKTIWKLYVPDIHAYGWDTQYHHWFAGVITKLDFGYSYDKTRDKVSKRIKSKIPYSFLFAIISAILIYLISIPLGVWTAYKQGSKWDKGIRNGLFAMDAIPSFWMAYLLILFWANPDIVGRYYLPVSFDLTNFASYILPLFAYTYGGLAFLSRQVRINVLAVSQEEYILAARSRGIPESTIWRKHILKNALLPLITIFGSFFPALVGGSIILEQIFSINGMGEYMISIIGNLDLPSIVAVFTLLGGMTMVGYLVSDILYHVVDPRIRLGREK